MIVENSHLVSLLNGLDLYHNPKLKTKLGRTWAKILTKLLREYAKRHTRLWYRAKLNRYTPFTVTYSKQRNSLIVWGLPPNENVSNAKKFKLIPLGKETTQTNSDRYHWLNPHYRRVHIKTDNDPNGLWITVKNQIPSESPDAWYTKTSHTTYSKTSDGHYEKSGSHNYPFPVKWFKEEGISEPQWDYQNYSVADNLFKRDEEFAAMYEKSLAQALDKLGLFRI